jgi:DNA-binding beta-propeller fold protein YncE
VRRLSRRNAREQGVQAQARVDQSTTVRWRPTAVVVSLAAGCLAAAAPAGAAFTQLEGPSGCVAQPDSVHREGGCAHAKALLGASGVAVSPDGRNLYVAAEASDSVTAFEREPSTGALTQLGCISQNGTNGFDGTGGECADGKALDGARGVAVSPDGAHVYVAAAASNAVAVFSRDPATGELTQAGCIEEFGEQVCYDGRALLGASAVAVAPDGRHVYVASPGSDAVAALSRDAGTGLLLSQSCISDDATDGACDDGVAMVGLADVAPAPDGARVFAAAPTSTAALSFDRDATSGLLRPAGCVLPAAPRGPCNAADELAEPGAVAVSPDGEFAYVASGLGRVSAVSIDPASGELRSRSCVEDTRVDEDEEFEDEDEFGSAGDSGPRCGQAQGLLGARGVTVTADGSQVLVAADSLAVFARDRRSGALTAENCVSDTGGRCDNGVGLRALSDAAVSPDGRNAYAVARDSASVTAFAEGTTAGASARMRGTAIAVRLRCPGTRAGGCVGRVAFERPRGRAATALGSRDFRLAAGHSATVAVPVSRRVRQALAARRRVRVSVVVTEPGALLRPIRHVVTLRGARR